MKSKKKNEDNCKQHSESISITFSSIIWIRHKTYIDKILVDVVISFLTDYNKLIEQENWIQCFIIIY